MQIIVCHRAALGLGPPPRALRRLCLLPLHPTTNNLALPRPIRWRAATAAGRPRTITMMVMGGGVGGENGTNIGIGDEGRTPIYMGEILLGTQVQLSKEASSLLLYHALTHILSRDAQIDLIYALVVEKDSPTVREKTKRLCNELSETQNIGDHHKYEVWIALAQIFIEKQDFQKAKEVCKLIHDVLPNDSRTRLLMTLIDTMLAVEKILDAGKKIENPEALNLIDEAKNSWEKAKQVCQKIYHELSNDERMLLLAMIIDMMWAAEKLLATGEAEKLLAAGDAEAQRLIADAKQSWAQYKHSHTLQTLVDVMLAVKNTLMHAGKNIENPHLLIKIYHKLSNDERMLLLVVIIDMMLAAEKLLATVDHAEAQRLIVGAKQSWAHYKHLRDSGLGHRPPEDNELPVELN